MATLPDPALVVLVGPSGSGKSTWAAERYRRDEIVSSDALRGVVGSGPHDLDASDDAFAILEQVVEARLGRGLDVTHAADEAGLAGLAVMDHLIQIPQVTGPGLPSPSRGSRSGSWPGCAPA